MNRRATLVAAALASLSFSGAAKAQPASWGSESAHTIAEDRLELGLFSEARWGVTQRLELSTHPVWFFALPQLQAKHQWVQSGRWLFSSRHRLAYPTLFLGLVAKEGALGLLPPTEDPPQALMIHNHALLSRDFGPHAVTLSAGAVVAPRASSNMPVLDFPFLYQRFAALYSSVVPQAGLAFEGALSDSFGYALEVELSWFSLTAEATNGVELDSVFALEEAARLDYLIALDWRISAGIRAAQAEFPVGFRSHLLPTLDLRVAY